MEDFCLGGAVKIRHDLRPECKVFHTRGKLADYYHDQPTDNPILTQAIFEGINKIRGVTDISIYQHTIYVYARPFSWEAILPQIKRVFASYLQWEVDLGKGTQ